MDYLLTFEDGSEGHLAHHGVKGMKWGQWNSETKARYDSRFKGGQTAEGGGSIPEDQDAELQEWIKQYSDTTGYSPSDEEIAEVKKRLDSKRKHEQILQKEAEEQREQRERDLRKTLQESFEKPKEMEHSGVKGMKWGVWNAETRARRNAVENAEVASALGKAKQYKKDNNSRYYKKARSDAFGVTLSGKTRGETTNIRVHGFDDSKYTRTSRRIGVEAAKIHAAAQPASSKSPYTDRLAEGYITYLTKHGRQRLDKANRSEIDLGKTTVQHLIAHQQQHLQLQNQMLRNQQMQQHSQEAVRQSINAANQAASLSMTGGTNPYMFGHM